MTRSPMQHWHYNIWELKTVGNLTKESDGQGEIVQGVCSKERAGYRLNELGHNVASYIYYLV